MQKTTTKHNSQYINYRFYNLCLENKTLPCVNVDKLGTIFLKSPIKNLFADLMPQQVYDLLEWRNNGHFAIKSQLWRHFKDFKLNKLFLNNLYQNYKNHLVKLVNKIDAPMKLYSKDIESIVKNIENDCTSSICLLYTSDAADD